MEREFHAYKFSRCMCPSNYNPFWDTARYLWKKASFYHTPLAFDAPVGGGGFRRNIGTCFSKEKLEWCRYPKVKKFRRYGYSFWRDPRTWQTDRKTDGRTLHDSIDRACIASRGKNGLTYRHSFFSLYGSPITLVLPASNTFTKFHGVTPCGALNTGGV